MALRTDPVFLGCTRPTMMFGVTLDFMLANGMVSMLLFLGTGQLLWLLSVIPGHAIAYLLCASEPRMLELLGLWAKTKGACINRGYWKASSYTPFRLRNIHEC
jgi:type IV secretion system protein VirB3